MTNGNGKTEVTPMTPLTPVTPVTSMTSMTSLGSTKSSPPSALRVTQQMPIGDILLAAWLVAVKGQAPQGRRRGKNGCEWLFTKSPELAGMIDSYLGEEGRAVRTTHEQLRAMKQQLNYL
jgi:hypothetical protein